MIVQTISSSLLKYIIWINLVTIEPEPIEEITKGRASYYSDMFQGRVTASGEIFDQNKLTAASNKYPLGTKLLITRIVSDDTFRVKVKVNDRIHKRFSHRTDLSKSAMKKIKGIKEGVVDIEIQEINNNIF